MSASSSSYAMQRGKIHPGDIAEAASLASIDLPPAKYPLFDALGDEFVENGKLSQLQLEGILYACQKHCEFAPDGKRSGFMIGDGAGVGKGRQISGIIIDNTFAGVAGRFGFRVRVICIATPSATWEISGAR